MLSISCIVGCLKLHGSNGMFCCLLVYCDTRVQSLVCHLFYKCVQKYTNYVNCNTLSALFKIILHHVIWCL